MEGRKAVRRTEPPQSPPGRPKKRKEKNMEKKETVIIEDIDEEPLCIDCIYSKALEPLSTLDDGFNGYCEFHCCKIDQTDNICKEYIEDYEQ